MEKVALHSTRVDNLQVTQSSLVNTRFRRFALGAGVGSRESLVTEMTIDQCTLRDCDFLGCTFRRTTFRHLNLSGLIAPIQSLLGSGNSPGPRRIPSRTTLTRRTFVLRQMHRRQSRNRNDLRCRQGVAEKTRLRHGPRRGFRDRRGVGNQVHCWRG